MQPNEDLNSPSEHTTAATTETSEKDAPTKNPKRFGLSPFERNRLQIPIKGEDLVNLELEKNRDYANVLADRLNLLQIRMNVMEHRFQCEEEESDEYSDDYILKNPHQIAGSKFRSLSESKRRNYILKVEQSYIRESNFGERVQYFPIMTQVQISLAVYSNQNFLTRHLLDYETALFCRLLWPVFDYAFPSTCKFMVMICVHKKVDGIRQNVPFVVEAPNECRRTWVFKCHLHELKMYTHL
jgi:hypothetical protein